MCCMILFHFPFWMTCSFNADAMREDYLIIQMSSSLIPRIVLAAVTFRCAPIKSMHSRTYARLHPSVWNVEGRCKCKSLPQDGRLLKERCPVWNNRILFCHWISYSYLEFSLHFLIAFIHTDTFLYVLSFPHLITNKILLRWSFLRVTLT